MKKLFHAFDWQKYTCGCHDLVFSSHCMKCLSASNSLLISELEPDLLN